MTEHSVRLTDLTREIRELEATMRDIRGVKKSKSSESLPTDGSASLTLLRERVARLRTQLEKERRLMAAAFPHEERKRRKKGQREGKAKQRELRVVS